jgi:hypothetical protein
MKHSLIHLVWIVGVMVLSACSTIETPQQAQEGDASVQDPTRIEFTQPLHFAGSDESDVVVPAGSYRVEQAPGSQIRLIPTGGGPPTVLGANAVPSDLKMAAPFALAMPSEPDVYDLVLLVPGGLALETRGSVSGVQPRGVSCLHCAAWGGPALVVEGPRSLANSPDLEPTSINWSCQGDRYFHIVVTNSGRADAGPSTARVAVRNQVFSFPTPGIRPGLSQPLTFPNRCFDDNTCTALLIVDALFQVAESNEGNNYSLPRSCTPVTFKRKRFESEK